MGVASFHLEAVARAGRQVLQLERAGDRKAIGRTGMTRVAVGAVVVAVHLMSRGSEVQRTPGLVETQIANDVRNVIAPNRVAREVTHAVATGGRRKTGEEVKRSSRGVDDTRGAVGLAVFDRDRARHTVAEGGGVGELIDAGGVVGAGEHARRDGRLGQRPLRIVLRNCLADGEARELDERIVDFHRSAAGDAGTAVAGPVELHVGIGTQNAVFGGGACVLGQVQTGFGLVPVLAVGLRGGCATLPRRRVVGRSVERRIDTDRAADANAGVGARDVPEAGTIEGADLHVFDRFGLDGKIGRLCAGQRDQTGRGAEHKALS